MIIFKNDMIINKLLARIKINDRLILFVWSEYMIKISRGYRLLHFLNNFVNQCEF